MYVGVSIGCVGMCVCGVKVNLNMPVHGYEMDGTF